MTGIDAASPHAGLQKRNALVVEDEVIISFLIQDLLEEFGCAVWHVGDVSEALKVLAERTPDFAVLDVNVAGALVYPVAEKLAERGVPFLFTTGYGRVGMPDRWSDRPVLQKPYDTSALSQALAGLVQTT